MTRPPTGSTATATLKTLVVTDLVDSTSLVERLGDDRPVGAGQRGRAVHGSVRQA